MVGAAVIFFLLGAGGIFGLWAVICGVAMIMGGVMMNSHPDQHVAWGVVVLIFSILSLGGLGGLGVGFILGLAGGALGIAWRPPLASAVQTPFLRFCPACGKTVDPTAKFCLSCGRLMP